MTVEQIKKLFFVRTDRIGTYPEMSLTPNGNIDGYITSHLKGDKRLGAYCLAKDSTVKWGVIDLDVRSEGQRHNVKKFLTHQVKLSKDVVLPLNIEVSKSSGLHFWLFFKEAVPAGKVRGFLRGFVRLVGQKAELPQKWVDSIEVFPKQDSLTENNRFGNFLWLPLFGGKDEIGGGVPQKKTVFYDDEWGLTSEPKVRLIDVDHLNDICELLNIQASTSGGEKKTSTRSFNRALAMLEEGVEKGHRNNAAFEIARHLKYKKLDRSYITAIMTDWNKKNNPPLSGAELTSVIESVFAHGNATPPTPEFNLSDAGNAELLIHLHGEDIRYNHTEGSWYLFNGQFWGKDTKREVVNFAIKAARHRQGLAASVEDHKTKKRLFTFGLSSESKVKIGFCLDLAKSMEPVSTKAYDWSRDPALLQFNNGLLNLSTMNFEPGRPEYVICQSVGYDYNSDADCPHWEKAIGEIMADNPAMVSFVQRALGYSLTGETSEQCVYLLHGTGANGKGVVLDTARAVLGDYAKDSPFSAFERRWGNSQSNDLARLHSARLVTSSESGESKRLDEERLKAITGSDPITARFLYQEYFTYRPQFKLWLAVNSLPRVEDFSFGFWRRIRLVPFDVRFVGEKDDKNLREKLKEERTGIMNWFLSGYQEWRKKGLMPPEEVIRATQDYQTESDPVAEFLDSFIVYDDSSRTKASTLYLRYCEWSQDEYPGKPLSQTSFGRRVALVTGVKSDKVGGVKYYAGLRLKDDSPL